MQEDTIARGANSSPNLAYRLVPDKPQTGAFLSVSKARDWKIALAANIEYDFDEGRPTVGTRWQQNRLLLLLLLQLPAQCLPQICFLPSTQPGLLFSNMLVHDPLPCCCFFRGLLRAALGADSGRQVSLPYRDRYPATWARLHLTAKTVKMKRMAKASSVKKSRITPCSDDFAEQAAQTDRTLTRFPGTKCSGQQNRPQLPQACVAGESHA